MESEARTRDHGPFVELADFVRVEAGSATLRTNFVEAAWDSPHLRELFIFLATGSVEVRNRVCVFGTVDLSFFLFSQAFEGILVAIHLFEVVFFCFPRNRHCLRVRIVFLHSA